MYEADEDFVAAEEGRGEWGVVVGEGGFAEGEEVLGGDPGGEFFAGGAEFGAVGGAAEAIGGELAAGAGLEEDVVAGGLGWALGGGFFWEDEAHLEVGAGGGGEDGDGHGDFLGGLVGA